MTAEPVSIRAIYRYPIKGLSPQALDLAPLSVGQTIPADRLYAIENGPSGFDPDTPAYFPKNRFLMLMRNERLASLRTHFDETSHTLTIESEGRRGRARRSAHEGRAVSHRGIFSALHAGELLGPPKVIFGKNGHSFSDVAKKVVSIINLASVTAVENAAGAPVNPLRFRGNLYVAGWSAWHEFDLVGQTLSVGKNARLKIVKRIQRCAATDVDPDTGIRDLTIPRTLLENFDHTDCGVYAEVVTAVMLQSAISFSPIRNKKRPARGGALNDLPTAVRSTAGQHVSLDAAGRVNRLCNRDDCGCRKR
jgi:uncharacterized protein YcbX